jgi:glycosyltransferase involved in cell wall biosynthesis
VRAVYREWTTEAVISGEEPPPVPFGADGGDAFTEWLMSPVPGCSHPEITVWLLEVWRSRPQLRDWYPRPTGDDWAELNNWSFHAADGVRLREELCIPESMQTKHRHGRRPTSSDRGTQAHGWNVVGYFSAELGVGEAARRMTAAVDGAGIATHLVALPAPYSRQRNPLRRDVASTLRYRDSLFCVNADSIEHAVNTMDAYRDAEGRPPLEGRRIGLWFWEVDQFPDRLRSSFDLVDEVWCTSEHTARAVADAPVPVHVVTLPVWAPSAPTPFTRRQLGLPEGFVFLASFDFESVFERKNPLGMVAAYQRAFAPSEGTTLVLKSINGRRSAAQMELLRRAIGGRPDIVIRDGYVDSRQMQGMIECCDCFVSLHRAEGFGLQLADAMMAGRPVIATGYSGNLGFMDDTSAFLVPYELIPVGPESWPYPATARWADPDLDIAAHRMRQVVDNAALARGVAERGRSMVVERQSLARASQDAAWRLFGRDSALPPVVDRVAAEPATVGA